MFFDDESQLQHLLTHRHSAKILNTWQQAKLGHLLPTLLSPERMLHLAKQADKLSLLYSFCHSGAQQSYYFVANQDELIKHQAYAAFINESIRANTLTC